MPVPGVAVVEEPKTLAERRKTAEACFAALDLRGFTGLVDGPDDAVDAAYEAWPDRLFVIDAEGRIAYRSGPGPFGFDVDAWERALRAETGVAKEGATPP
jgi:hypothetical protein